MTLTTSLVAGGVALLAAAGALGAAAPTIAASPHLSSTDDHVRAVVIAVPDLRWSDLADMPSLRSFAATAAVGDLSVKTVEPRADCADGLLSFNAGNRVDSGVPGCGLTLSQYVAARRKAADSSFDAQVGALGQALRSAGIVTEALDVNAVPMLADGAGQVGLRPDQTPPAAAAPTVQAVVDDGLYVGRPEQRPVSAGLLDREIHDQIAELPEPVTVVVAGISDAPRGAAHLHVLLVRHQGWGHVELARPSTPPPYIQLIDLAPTMLQLLGEPVPDSMDGRPLHVTTTKARDWTAYADDDRHAQAARMTSRPLRYSLAIASLAILLLILLAGARLGTRVTGTAATWLARLVVGVPVFAFLIQRVPWWRSSALVVGLEFAGAALAFAVVVTVCARRHVVAGLLVVPAITVLALLVDQLAGSPLQISAPLGDSPLVAGRFQGMGNIDFAVFATAALLCAGVVGGLLAARGQRSLGAVVAATIGGLALVVDGAPPLGDDAGGAVTLLPAVAVLLAVLLGVRISWRRALAVLAVALVAVLGLGLADHARGSGAETHLGRFVGQLLRGGGGSDVQRRLAAVGRSFGNVPFTLLVAAALLAVVATWRPLGRRVGQVPGLPAALAGVATVAVLGTVLNDSGVVVATFAIVVALAAIVGAGVLSDAANRSRAGVAG